MAPWRFLIVLPILLQVPATGGRAQEKPVRPQATYRFERLEGLSHNTVTALAQDRQGYLWFGTSDGLNRYDGHTFAVYRHHPGDSTSLANNAIKALLEDRQGRLWVGTDKGLHRYDRRTDTFVRYPIARDALTAYQWVILDLLEDTEGFLWVATSAGGLYRMHPETGATDVYGHTPGDPHSLADDSVWDLFQDEAGALWVVTSRALHRYEVAENRFTRYPLPGSPHAGVVLHAVDGKLWLSRDGWARSFDVTTARFADLPDFARDLSLYAHCKGEDGSEWIGTPEGLYRYAPDAGTLAPVPTDPSPGAYLQNHIRTLFRDRAGTLWAGTLSGLFRHDPNAKPFRHLGHAPLLRNGLSAGVVMAVLEDRDGILWAGTLGGGLNRIDREANRITAFLHRAGDPHSLCNDRIWALHEDSRGGLWIGTDEGLCKLDRARGRFTRFALPLPDPAARQPAVTALQEGTGGALWVASWEGLYRMDLASGKTRLFFGKPGHRETMQKSVQSLYLDRSGVLWFGLFGGVLFRYRQGWAAPRPVGMGAEPLVTEGIWAIHEDAAGIFWLGSDQGLTRLDIAHQTTQQFTQEDGLPGTVVYALLEDEAERLWLSTNQGLVRLQQDAAGKPHFRAYDTGDGLENIEFNRRAAFRSPQGEFFFGGLEGLSSFYPAQIRDNPYLAPVVLTRIRVASRDTTRTLHPAGLDHLVLSYRDYAFSFEFAALNYTNPAQNRYRYQIEGFDQGWIEAGTRRFAQYTNLPPGDYVFRVLGANDDGLWNEHGAALRLTITPPFWRTWWFRLLLLAAVLGLLTLAYRIRVARLIALERLRLRLAGDLHDDIGSNLSSIALLSDMVRNRAHLAPREQRHLSKISDSARAMVDALHDIVWSIDPDADRLEDLLERMQDAAADLLGEIQWTFQGPAPGPTVLLSMPVLLNMEVRRHVFLIYKEALHNVARHARASRVGLRLEARVASFCLTITDDGIGFDPTVGSSGSGLRTMRDRADRIGASLDVQSRPGAGTTLRLDVPRSRSPGPFHLPPARKTAQTRHARSS